jgi:hypothetical protein
MKEVSCDRLGSAASSKRLSAAAFSSSLLALTLTALISLQSKRIETEAEAGSVTQITSTSTALLIGLLPQNSVSIPMDIFKRACSEEAKL